MAKIKVISKCELFDGMSITFRAPCDCTAVDGLNVYYNEYSQSFSFRDAHRNDLAGLDHLFTEGTYIKAILDTGRGYAYLQNTDTNSYIENDFKNLFYLKDETLTDATKTMYGLGAFATPNTIFQKLAMPYGYYGFDITVVTEDGLPVPNVVLNGLEDFEGNTPVTNENGRYALAVSESSTPTLTISKYLGIVNGSHALSSDDSYVFTPYTIVVAKDTTTRTISSSDTYNIFAPEGTVVDLCAVGGGGGGGYSDGYDGVKGAGGGGGYCSNLTNITSISTGEISFAVGGGGGGASGNNGVLNGSAGGTTKITYNGTTLLSANGGSGGTGYVSSSGGGGAGNGRGGHVNGGAGVAATVYLFDDTTLGLPGGGGGGAALNGAGGAPYGGKGGNYSTAPTGGTGPGGGGGGSMGNKNVGTHVAGSGYKGGVFV